MLIMGLIALMREEPATGYALARALGDAVGCGWPVSRAAVYRTLARMTGAGLVVSHPTGPGQGVRYAVTERGCAKIDAWIRNGPRDAMDAYAEIIVRLAAASKRSRSSTIDQLRMEEAICTRAMAAARASSAARPPSGDVARWAAARREALLRAHLDWLQSVRAELAGGA